MVGISNNPKQLYTTNRIFSTAIGELPIGTILELKRAKLFISKNDTLDLSFVLSKENGKKRMAVLHNKNFDTIVMTLNTTWLHLYLTKY